MSEDRAIQPYRGKVVDADYKVSADDKPSEKKGFWSRIKGRSYGPSESEEREEREAREYVKAEKERGKREGREERIFSEGATAYRRGYEKGKRPPFTQRLFGTSEQAKARREAEREDRRLESKEYKRLERQSLAHGRAAGLYRRGYRQTAPAPRTSGGRGGRVADPLMGLGLGMANLGLPSGMGGGVPSGQGVLEALMGPMGGTGKQGYSRGPYKKKPAPVTVIYNVPKKPQRKSQGKKRRRQREPDPFGGLLF